MLDILRSVDPLYMILGLAGALFICFLFIIILLVKVSRLKKKYQMFMTGHDGKSIEEKIYENFDVMNDVVGEQRRVDREVKKVQKMYSHAFSKMKVYKYDAFPNMGGETSFVIGLLDDNDSGVLLNGMNRENGTYVYAKEIINGNSQVALSKEEMVTLEGCMNQ